MAEINKLTEKEQQIYDDIFHAYMFTLPLVATVLYMQADTNVKKIDGVHAPINQLANEGELWKPEDKRPGGPNMDTVYSHVKFDLSKEPLVFHKPEMDRFHTFLILDAFGGFVELLGSGGIAGRKEADFLFYGPDYSGEVPDNLIPVRVPTNFATGLGRVQIMNGETNILNLQQQFTIKPLKYMGKEYAAPAGEYVPEHDFNPYQKMRNSTLDEFFAIYNQAVELNPVIPEEQAEAAKYEKYNIGAQKKFILSEITDGSLKEALESSAVEWFDKLSTGSWGGDIRNGWEFFPQDVTLPGSDYYYRAKLTHWGIGCNPAKAALYPMGRRDQDGNLLNGNYNYKIHFEKDQLPPLKEDGYWSISNYTAGDLFLIQNPYGIYKVGSESELLFNEDGSLDIYIQKQKPEDQRINNWLPVNTEGNFELCFRLYIPDEAAIEGIWKPPVIERVG